MPHDYFSFCNAQLFQTLTTNGWTNWCTETWCSYQYIELPSIEQFRTVILIAITLYDSWCSVRHAFRMRLQYDIPFACASTIQQLWLIMRTARDMIISALWHTIYAYGERCFCVLPNIFGPECCSNGYLACQSKYNALSSFVQPLAGVPPSLLPFHYFIRIVLFNRVTYQTQQSWLTHSAIKRCHRRYFLNRRDDGNGPASVIQMCTRYVYATYVFNWDSTLQALGGCQNKKANRTVLLIVILCCGFYACGWDKNMMKKR